MGEIKNRSGASPTGVNAGNDDTRNAVRDAATVACDGAAEQAIVVRSVDDHYRADCEAGTKTASGPIAPIGENGPTADTAGAAFRCPRRGTPLPRGG